MQNIRIFISSPGDVAEERRKAKQVIESLQKRYADQLELIPVLWEDLAIPATASFQEGIELVLSQSQRIDVAIFILWARMGSPLGSAFRRGDGSEYHSGTEREFDLMLSAFEQSGGKCPVILAYTRKDDEGFNNILDARKVGDDALDDLLQQRRLVKSFIQENFKDGEGRNLRAYHSYREPIGFAERLHVHLRGTLDGLLGQESNPTLWSNPPYRSLEVFDVQHSPIFCGRDEETCELLQRLRDQEATGRAFVCIVGASGSGKSSLARAGVVGNLLQRFFDDGVKEWRACVLIPGLGSRSLIDSLVQSLSEQIPGLADSVGGLDRLTTRLRENHQAASDLLGTAFRTAHRTIGGPLRILLVIDQMEELWTERAITLDEREQFLEAIEVLSNCGSVSVLATLRSDFYPLAQLSECFLRLKGDRGHFDLTPPGTAALQELIVKPAQRSGLTFERDARTGRTLDQRILEDAARDPSALPLLQFALADLYEHRDLKLGQLTYSAYDAMGGVEGSLGRRLAVVFDALEAEPRDALEELLPLLVTVDTQRESGAARRRARIEDLCCTDAREALTSSLIAARFLTTDQDGDGHSVASLAHESLLRNWPRLTEWLEKNRDLLRLRTQVEQSEARWRQSGYNPSLFLSPGLPLDEGCRLLATAPELLAPTTVDYVNESIGHDFSTRFENGRGLVDFSVKIESMFPAQWRRSLENAFESITPATRRNLASLLGSKRTAEFEERIVDLAITDSDESVRQAAALSLIQRERVTAFDQVLQTVESTGRPTTYSREGKLALARLLAVSDMQPIQPEFEKWFQALPANLRRSIQVISWKLRLKRALPVFLFVVIPAATFAVAGAASIKWLTSALNFSCVQANPSAFMGLFHSAIAGIILGGSIVTGLTLYRMVFGQEFARVSRFRPLPALAFGAVFGLLSGFLCVFLITQVYLPQSLEQIGWTEGSNSKSKGFTLQGQDLGRLEAAENSENSSLGVLFHDLYLGNRCGFPFPLTSAGLGIALALMTNALRASRQWPEFLDRQSAISGIGQLWKVIVGIIKVTLPFARPIPILVTVCAGLSLFAMNSANVISTPKELPISEIYLGGMHPETAHRTQWKKTCHGRALGLFGDGLSKIFGGYFAIVGMALGIVTMRHGVQISPRHIHG